MLLAVGADESPEFHRQSREFARIWGQAGLSIDYLAIDGANHFTVLEQFASSESQLLQPALRLFGSAEAAG